MKQFTEDTLLRHAQFICDQVLSFDDAAESDDDLFITTPCMRSLANLAGIILGRGKFIRMTHHQRHQRKLSKEIKKQTWSKASTTKLVSDMFENIFADQIAEHDTTSVCIIILLLLFVIKLLENISSICFSRDLEDIDAVFVKIVYNPIAESVVTAEI